jgi:hypothetical protein
MANVLVERQVLTDTANAIRTKLGTTAEMKPREFAANIAMIQGVSGLKVLTMDGNTLVFPDGHCLVELEQKQIYLPTKIVLVK